MFNTMSHQTNANQTTKKYHFTFTRWLSSKKSDDNKCCQGSREIKTLIHHQASLVAQTVKNLPAMQAIWVQSLGQEDPLEKGMATHPSILAGEFHGQRSLVGYSPQGGKEQDTTEQLTHTSICYRFVHLECLLDYNFLLLYHVEFKSGIHKQNKTPVKFTHYCVQMLNIQQQMYKLQK